jgi:hypothetical protein
VAASDKDEERDPILSEDEVDEQLHGSTSSLSYMAREAAGPPCCSLTEKSCSSIRFVPPVPSMLM